MGGYGGGGGNHPLERAGAGGSGGPGLIQLHTPDGSSGAILLRPGVTLEDYSLPDVHVLLPEAAF